MANKIPSTRNTTNNNNNNKNVKILPQSTTILLICVCVCVFRLAAASQSIEWTAASQQRCKSSFRMQPSEHTQSPCIKRCDRFEKSVCYFSSFGESQKPFFIHCCNFLLLLLFVQNRRRKRKSYFVTHIINIIESWNRCW